ncbi:MAG: hypothetical protein HQK91_01155 [Nitrospirae bacterium]|nr:hypothetical protein [Nitrospirota bacterium]MBF0540044.1 hypothetical protein [Nitrospirota bacterium]
MLYLYQVIFYVELEVERNMITMYFEYMEKIILIILILSVLRIIVNFIMLSSRPLIVIKRKMSKMPLFPIKLTLQDIEVIQNIEEKDWYQKRNALILIELNKEKGTDFKIEDKLNLLFKDLKFLGNIDVHEVENMVYLYHKQGIDSAINYYEGNSFAPQAAILSFIGYIFIHNFNNSIRILRLKGKL